MLFMNVTSKDKVVSIIIDKKYTNKLLSSDFDNYIRHDLACRSIDAIVR